MRQKRCTGCREWKPLDAFWPRRGRGRDESGEFEREPECKACAKASARARYWDDPERARRRQRARARARSRGYIRLTKLVPELWDRVYAEELAKEADG